jgi:hypothetical protein
MWTQRLLICFLLTTTALSASALERPFPPVAKRGTMSPAISPAIVIDGKARVLSHAARIWNQRNLITRPSSLQGSGFVVNYTEDRQGNIDRVWILTDEEASQSLKPRSGS